MAELPIDAQLELSRQVKLLTLPAEMGENSKCLGLSRESAARTSAFGMTDRTVYPMTRESSAEARHELAAGRRARHRAGAHRVPADLEFRAPGPGTETVRLGGSGTGVRRRRAFRVAWCRGAVLSQRHRGAAARRHRRCSARGSRRSRRGSHSASRSARSRLRSSVCCWPDGSRNICAVRWSSSLHAGRVCDPDGAWRIATAGAIGRSPRSASAMLS